MVIQFWILGMEIYFPYEYVEKIKPHVKFT